MTCFLQMKFYFTLTNNGPAKTGPFDIALSPEKSGYGPEISLLCVVSIVTTSDAKIVVNTTSLSTAFGAKLVIFTVCFLVAYSQVVIIAAPSSIYFK